MRCIRILIILICGISILFTGCNVRSKNAPDITPSDYIQGVNGDEPLDADWIIYVDQTIPITKDGLTTEYTLVLAARKAGGKDVYGTYEGAAYISCKLDMSELTSEFMKIMGGFDIQAYSNAFSFDVVPFINDEYTNYGKSEDSIPMMSLVEYESMALVSPNMTGTGIINPNISGQNGEIVNFDEDVSGTLPIPIAIAIKSGKVYVTLPTIQMEYSYEGIITGEPQESSAKYQLAIARLEELIEEAASEEDES